MHTENGTHSSVALPETARAVRAFGKCARCVWGTTLSEGLVACAFGRCVQQEAALGRQTWTEGAKA